MLKRLRKSNGGFSLIELLLGMAIFSFGLLLITYGIISLIRIYSNGIADRATQNAARVAMDRIVQVGRQGSSYAYGDTSLGITNNTICIYGNQTIFFINGNILYQANWTGTDNSSCNSSFYSGTPVPITPTSNVQVYSLKGEQTDNYSGTTAVACAATTPCKGLRVDLQVVNNTASVDANGNCLPTVAICSSTSLSTSMTAGVL